MVTSRYAVGDGSVDRARQMRREISPVERQLWQAVRGNRIEGYKFRRQQRIGPYFADFCCQSERLVIEVDGDSHAGQEHYDSARTAWLEEQGYRVLRFTNNDVVRNLEGVAEMIRLALLPSPSRAAEPRGPLPLPQGERGR